MIPIVLVIKIKFKNKNVCVWVDCDYAWIHGDDDC